MRRQPGEMLFHFNDEDRCQQQIKIDVDSGLIEFSATWVIL
jgi:hypothetical protein